MKDYTKLLPEHIEKFIGEQDLFVEIYESQSTMPGTTKAPPLLFVHGAYTGSWMWSKYIPHFLKDGWKCIAMNLRSHYKSRSMDLTRTTFEDYLADIKEIIAQCGEAPILIGFSLGGTLSQKIAETERLAGLVLIDSSLCKEVNELEPYESPVEFPFDLIVPAPAREERVSPDESEEDIAFQKKYLSMESSLAFRSSACWAKGIEGISVNSALVTCPVLVIRAVNSESDDRRGKAEAAYYRGEYTGLQGTTHTGLLVGQRYLEAVDRILAWLKHVKA